MNAEPVAKLVLTSPDNTIVLPYGPSGRLNLPGGGLEPHERPIDGLARELEEEIGLPISEISRLRLVGKKMFSVTTASGEPRHRMWNIFSGRTELNSSDFMFGEEIQGVASLRSEQMYGHKKVNRSAKVAVALSRRATGRLLLR